MDKTEQMQQEVLRALCDGNIPVTNLVIGDQVQNKTINNYYGQSIDSEEDTAHKSKRGAPIKYLFANKEKGKDIDQTAEQAANFMRFLKDHKLDKVTINSKANDRLNVVMRCFIEAWIKKDMISKDFSMAALVRFLEEDCHLRFDVDHSAFKSCINQMLEQKYNQELYYDVQEYFN